MDLRIFAKQTTYRCPNFRCSEIIMSSSHRETTSCCFQQGTFSIYCENYRKISITPLMLVLCPSWLHIYCCHYYVYYCHFAQCHIPILFLPRRQRSLISSEGRRVVVHQSLELQMRLREDFMITEKARTSVFNVKVLVGAFNQVIMKSSRTLV